MEILCWEEERKGGGEDTLLLHYSSTLHFFYFCKKITIMQNTIFSFERLDVWKYSKDLVISVYSLLGDFPSVEKYALCDQIRRAVVSVSSNIAEGNGRVSLKERIHFIEIAYGSLMEVYSQLLIAVDLHYISEAKLNPLKEQFIKVAIMLVSLRTSCKKRLKEMNM